MPQFDSVVPRAGQEAFLLDQVPVDAVHLGLVLFERTNGRAARFDVPPAA